MNRSVITIGQFDGVHLGHRAILRRAREQADAANAPLIAMTFEPHPATVLRPGTQPPRLLSAQEKVARLKDAGADEVRVIRPTSAWLGQTAQAFIQRLAAEHHPAALVEGGDFRFGKGRAGDVGLLQRLGQRYHFQTIVVPKTEAALSDQSLAPVSSSLVRWLIAHGRVVDAARCLDQPFRLTAPVVRGEQRGRTLGVPTANLDLHALADHQLPAHGVYTGYASVGSPPHVQHPTSNIQHLPTALSVGDKPTFAGRRLAIEAHLLDFAGDLYGQPLTVTFEHWLRDQYPLPNLDLLQAQLHRDLAQTRRWHERKSRDTAAA